MDGHEVADLGPQRHEQLMLEAPVKLLERWRNVRLACGGDGT
jgi:hypothetical protein